MALNSLCGTVPDCRQRYIGKLRENTLLYSLQEVPPKTLDDFGVKMPLGRLEWGH